MTGMFATGGLGFVSFALAIVLALGALRSEGEGAPPAPSADTDDGEGRNLPTRLHGSPLASVR